MNHNYPDFYKEFHCLAGSCTDTCCQGWDIVIDEETQALYEGLPGPLGDALRQAMITDEDGDRIIRMNGDGFCPMLSADRLCRVQLALGENGPCQTCRKFPRLTQDFGKFIDYGLSLACPEAARLILTHKGPWTVETEQDEVREEETDLDWVFMDYLEKHRRQLLDQVLAEGNTDGQALSICLAGASALQDTLNGHPNREPGMTQTEEHYIRKLLQLHRDLEILTPEWEHLLDEALSFEDPLPRLPQTGMGKNLAADYLYRYWLLTVNDFDCLTNMELLCINWVAVKTLARVELAKNGTITEDRLLWLFHLYAKEVEHDDINREDLAEALFSDPELTVAALDLLVSD